jgi:hypothetical protein
MVMLLPKSYYEVCIKERLFCPQVLQVLNVFPIHSLVIYVKSTWLAASSHFAIWLFNPKSHQKLVQRFQASKFLFIDLYQLIPFLFRIEESFLSFYTRLFQLNKVYLEQFFCRRLSTMNDSDELLGQAVLPDPKFRFVFRLLLDFADFLFGKKSEHSKIVHYFIIRLIDQVLVQISFGC